MAKDAAGRHGAQGKTDLRPQRPSQAGSEEEVQRIRSLCLAPWSADEPAKGLPLWIPVDSKMHIGVKGRMRAAFRKWRPFGVGVFAENPYFPPATNIARIISG